MNKSLAICVLALLTTGRVRADDLYLANFAIFPAVNSKGCAFVMARDANQKTVADFRPSVPFMKAACLHFHAVWQEHLPAGVVPDYESAVWHTDSPDNPTFMQQAKM